MAANSIFWKLPEKFSFFSRTLNRKVEVQAYVMEFRRLLPCDGLGFQEVTNKELLHGVVGLYDVCLPDITPDVLYGTVCGKWAKTLIFIRSLSDVLKEQREKVKSKNKNTIEEEKNAVQSEGVELHVTVPQDPIYLTEKHVHWEDETIPMSFVEMEEKLEQNKEKIKEQLDPLNVIDIAEQTVIKNEPKSLKTDSKGIDIHDKHKEKKEEEEEDEKQEEEPGMFDGVFSDSEGEQESSDEEEDEEDFSVGVNDFVAAAKERKNQKESGNVSKETIGIESLLVGAASYERIYGKPKEKVMQISLLAVRKRYQKCGVGKMILNTLKDPTFIGPYDSIAVYADHSAIDFFKKNDFTDDVVLNSRFTRFRRATRSDISGVHRSDHEILAMEEEISLWQNKSLEAYQAQLSCMVRMKHEIRTLKALVDTQEEVIKTLTKAKERLQKSHFKLEKKILDMQLEKEESAVIDLDEKESDDEDFYESLVSILNKQHINEEHSQLDMEAISRGDFGDVSKEDEELLSSLIHSQSEKTLMQQTRRSLLATGLYDDVNVTNIYKVECSHVALLETSLEGYQHRNPKSPPIVKQLFFCGGYSDNSKIDNIITRGFTKEDFTQGIYGKGLYFTRRPSHAAQFSPPGKLLLVNVSLGATESVYKQDKRRMLPPAGFDSILTPGRPTSPVSPRCSNQAEYVVFDPMQAVPVYLIEYSTSKT
ncbi:uncharacterized protein LOC116302833 [Actinia tenebrosa]|uniref:Uncharacterized protein LOC116302833 n=1 Tax=Actinia tenebrosa TaxID=6105 RepID=A0A6P8INJ6_ACTTE|nr:uncharacterized protein LOC116302833 [Actinia tenebrosa]